jgi:broad specificity phosphatase PhoE
MLDPALSDKGIQQAKNIDKLFPKLKERLMKNGIILASPMRRAFLTMAYAFPHLADNQTAYELWPLL